MDTVSFSEEYLAVLKKFDILNLIIILFLGLATFPLAFFVYYKLLTAPSFKDNYTFRLIAIAGLVDFLVYLADLIFLQCSTYTALNWFFDFLNETGLSRFSTSCVFTLCFLQILLSLAVAINRLLFMAKRRLLQMHGRLIFFSSIGVSMCISVICSVITHQRNFTYVSTYMGAGEYAHSPSNGELPSYLGYTLLILSVSSMLFLVSIFLARSIFAYRRQISLGGGKSVEKGLIVVAISNFVNYIVFIGAMLIGTYCDIPYLCYSVCLFLTIACVSPFWCLFIFGKSVRQSIFTRSCTKVNVPSISSNSNS